MIRMGLYRTSAAAVPRLTAVARASALADSARGRRAAATGSSVDRQETEV